MVISWPRNLVKAESPATRSTLNLSLCSLEKLFTRAPVVSMILPTILQDRWRSSPKGNSAEHLAYNLIPLFGLSAISLLCDPSHKHPRDNIVRVLSSLYLNRSPKSPHPEDGASKNSVSLGQYIHQGGIPQMALFQLSSFIQPPSMPFPPTVFHFAISTGIDPPPGLPPCPLRTIVISVFPP